MFIRSFMPAGPLRPYVRCYMTLESDNGMTNRVLPDTGLVMVFRLRGITRHLGHTALPPAAISGIGQSARMIDYAPSTTNLLIVFHDAGAAPFFSLPLHELAGMHTSLDHVLPKDLVQKTEDRLSNAITDTERVAVIDNLLLGLLEPQPADKAILSAIASIKQAAGNINISQLASSLHLSRDPFGKRFRRITGTTPRHFASIVRLRHIIGSHIPGTSLTTLAYNAGYFDQAHFIHDFRALTGITPGEYFSASPSW